MNGTLQYVPFTINMTDEQMEMISAEMLKKINIIYYNNQYEKEQDIQNIKEYID